MAEFTVPTDVPANGSLAAERRGKVVVAASIEIQHYLETALTALGYASILVDDGRQLVRVLSAGPDPLAILFEQGFASPEVLDEIVNEFGTMNRVTGSRMPIGLITADGSGDGISDEWIARGAVVPLPGLILYGDLRQTMANLTESPRRAAGPVKASPDAARASTFRGAVFQPENLSPQMRRIARLIEQAALCDVPVLVQGETGVGKEMLVRAIHERSARASQSFVSVNCAALPRELVESQLFGYERGAFTGATRNQPGLFEIADGGTIFLDEIGDMDIRLQAKLLQVLQDHEIHPLGASASIQVDVRVMAATHRDLRMAMANGQLREDLYYRLNVISIVIPPLRERREEILPLAEFLLRKHAGSQLPIPQLDAELKSLLLSHHWPGNVRELENMIRRYIVLRDPSVFDELRGATEPVSASNGKPARVPLTDPPVRSIFEMLDHAKNKAQIEALLAALATAQWNRRKAADLLRVDYKSLLYQMKKFQIGAAGGRSRAKNGSRGQGAVASGSPALAVG